MRPGIKIRMTKKESQLLEKILMDYGMKRTKKETWEWLRLFYLRKKETVASDKHQRGMSVSFISISYHFLEEQEA